MNTMTTPARGSAAATFAAAEPGRDPRPADVTARLQRRRDQRIAAAAEANWLLALR